jgi:CBS domain containing-hemolysin-like protein
MKLTQKTVRDLMVPLAECPVVTTHDPLSKAVLRLSKEYLEPSAEVRHRTILVVDDNRQLVGILDFSTILESLIPGRVAELGEKLDSILKQAAFAEAGLQGLEDVTQDFTEKVLNLAETRVKDVMLHIRDTNQADENLLTAIRMKCRKKITVLPVYHEDKLVGVLRDVDLFLAVADVLRARQQAA